MTENTVSTYISKVVEIPEPGKLTLTHKVDLSSISNQ